MFPVSINKCVFKSHEKIVNLKNESIQYFTNNEVFINMPNTVLFNGEFTGTVKFCWIFNMNCIYPFDEKHFKNSDVIYFL